MTDYEKLKQLFDEFGIEYENQMPDYFISPFNNNEKIIYIATGYEKVGGDGSYSSMFEFDVNGKFLEISIGE